MILKYEGGSEGSSSCNILSKEVPSSSPDRAALSFPSVSDRNAESMEMEVPSTSNCALLQEDNSLRDFDLPKPFFIMDWLEKIDPAHLELAQRMLRTPQKAPEIALNAAPATADNVQPRQLFSAVTAPSAALLKETQRTTSFREYQVDTSSQNEEKDCTPAKTAKQSMPQSKISPASFFKRRSIAIGNGWNAKGLSKAKQGLWEDALACWENALEVRTQVLGEDHLDVANTYNNMGIAYGKLDQSSQAISSLQNALDIRVAFYGNQHPEVAATLHNIGNVLQQSGELDAAIDYFARAKDIQEDVFDGNHVQVARASLAMGHAYYQGKQYEKAHEAFCDALIIFEHLAESGLDYSVEIQATRADVQELEDLMYPSGEI